MTKKILFEDALILNAARCSSFLLRLLPVEAALWVGRRIGSVVYFFSKRRRIALRNLRAAFAAELSPEKIDSIARGSFQTMAMSAVELLRFPAIDDVYIAKNLKITGSHHYEPSLKRGQGVIFLTGHFGNWELLNMAGSLLSRPVVVLARKQKHPRSDEFLNQLRALRGTQIVLKGMPVRELMRALHDSKIIGMLSDQDGGKNGAKVLFFGRTSSTPRGAAAFALRTQAPIFPVFVVREGDSALHRIEVEAPLKMPGADVGPEEAERDLLQQFSEILESKVRTSPAQWLWAHRRWKSTPDRRVLVLSDEKTGHLNQSLALLHEIAFSQGTELSNGSVSHRVVRVRFKNRPAEILLKAVVFIFGKRAPFRRLLLKAALEDSCRRELLSAYADIVVSCGSRLGAVNLLISAENFAKSAALMRPFEPARHFDAVIAPKHDKIKPAANVFLTEIAPCSVTPAEVDLQAQFLARNIEGLENDRRRKIGLLVGGDTDKASFSRERFERILKEILRYGVETDAAVLATSSRRTPPWADELLKRSLGDRQRCPVLVIANESNRVGVVAGILGLCDAVIVSGESISMVSEAITAGKPVIVFIPSDAMPLKPKHKEFLDRMIAAGLVTIAVPENIYEMMRTSATEMNGHTHLFLERDRLTLRRAVAERLLS